MGSKAKDLFSKLRKLRGRSSTTRPQPASTSDPELKPYIYEPLQGSSDIRILSLTHSSDDRLVCTFEIVHDLVNADYQALSYEWGSKDIVHKISVEDRQGRQLGGLDVNINLYHALKDLRNTTALCGQRFWIDQLSIDQSNILEKGHQVALMTDVYTHATQVITYLGPHNHDMARELGALDLLDQLHRHFLPNYVEISATVETGEKKDTSTWPVQKLPLNVTKHDPAWDLLMSIVDGGWMHRLWMVQENISCPHNVMLRGTRLLDWFSVASVPILCDMHIIPLDMSIFRNDSSRRDVFAFSDVSDLWRYRKGHLAGEQGTDFGTLGYNLAQYANRKCEDPRDRIYAVTGISSNAAVLDIQPDYALPVHKLYIDISVQMYNHDLVLLEYMAVVNNLSDALSPSWAYQGTSQQEDYLPSNPDLPHPRVSNNVKFSADKTVMSLRGMVFDRVAIVTLSGRRPGIYATQPVNELWAEHYNTRLLAITTLLNHIGVSLQSAGALYRVITDTYDRLNNESSTDAAYNLWIYCLGRAILLNQYHATKSVTAHDELPRTVKNFLQSLGRLLVQHGKAASESVGEVDFDDIREEYRKYRTGNLDGLSLCISEHGRLCKLTGKARLRDVIAVLPGHQRPCVLRPCGEDRYQYVGHGYVHGVMAGELYNGVDPDEVDHDIHLV